LEESSSPSKTEGETLVSPTSESIEDMLRRQLRQAQKTTKRLKKMMKASEVQLKTSVEILSGKKKVEKTVDSGKQKRPTSGKQPPKKKTKKSKELEVPVAQVEMDTDVPGEQNPEAVSEVVAPQTTNPVSISHRPEGEKNDEESVGDYRLEEGEENDELSVEDNVNTFKVGTRIAGSRVGEEGHLYVYLEWDEDPTKLTCDRADFVWADFPEIFGNLAVCPPRLKRFKEEKEKERLEKQEEKKKKKAQKKQLPKEKPRFVCTHDDMGSLSEETKKTWCCPTAYLHGGKCSSCSIKFVEKKKNDNEIEPSNKNPVHVCRVYSNQSADCTFALCSKCYASKLLSAPRTIGRSR
jgi:hypothetical protein